MPFKNLSPTDAKYYCKEIADTIEELERKIEELEQKLLADTQAAHDKGFDEGYAQAEKDLKPKPFVFR